MSDSDSDEYGSNQAGDDSFPSDFADEMVEYEVDDEGNPINTKKSGGKTA